MATDDSVKAGLDHIYDTYVAFDEDKMQKNKRIAKLVVSDFCKYLRENKLCEVAMKGQGKFLSLWIEFVNF